MQSATYSDSKCLKPIYISTSNITSGTCSGFGSTSGKFTCTTVPEVLPAASYVQSMYNPATSPCKDSSILLVMSYLLNYCYETTFTSFQYSSTMMYNKYASINCDPSTLTSSSSMFASKCLSYGQNNQSIASAFYFPTTTETSGTTNDGKSESFASQHIALLAEIIGGGVGVCLILIVMVYFWFRCSKYERKPTTSYSVNIPVPIITATAVRKPQSQSSHKYQMHKWINKNDETQYI